MEKIIKIDGKDVKFKATGGTMYRYKTQFGREYLADIVALEKCRIEEPDGSGGTKKSYDMTKFSLETMYNLAWVLAKTADDKIPPPQEWLDSFETFPIIDIWKDLNEIISQNSVIDRKNG